MKQNHIIGLGVLAIALLGAAVYVADSRKPAREAPVAGPLLPTLESRLNEVTAVAVKPAGADSITLKREGDAWRVVEKGGYPADTVKLRELLLKLAQAQRTAAKTALPASYAVLGVQDVDTEGANNVLISVSTDAPAFEVILGQNNSRGAGTFVRLRDESQSWLVDQNISAERTATAWMKRDLLDIARYRITEISIDAAEGGAVEIEAKGEGDGDFRLANLPAGREQSSDFVADATAGVLSGLRIDDVQPVDSYTAAESALTTRADFRTREGIQVSLEMHSVGDEHWTKFAVSFDETVASERIEGALAREVMIYEHTQDSTEPSDAETATGEAAEQADVAVSDPPLAVTDPQAFRTERMDESKAEAADLQKSFEGWVFKLPAAKADTLKRGMDAYLKPRS